MNQNKTLFNNVKIALRQYGTINRYFENTVDVPLSNYAKLNLEFAPDRKKLISIQYAINQQGHEYSGIVYCTSCQGGYFDIKQIAQLEELGAKILNYEHTCYLDSVYASEFASGHITVV